MATRSTPQLPSACSVDEVDLGITEVIRGEDLLASTHTHITLMDRLGHAPPSYRHLPLVTHPTGQKLSKQNLAAPLSVANAQSQMRTVLGFLIPGWVADGPSVSHWLADAITQFDLDRMNSIQGWIHG